MRRAPLVAVLALAAGCASPPPAPLAPEERPVRSRPLEESIADGARWLVENQRPGGYWGTGCVTWGYDIYGSVPSAQFAFKVGTTGLCAMALREEGSPRSLESARKAEDWLIAESVKLRRGDEDEIYNVWGDIYALQALAFAAGRETDAGRAEKLKAAAAVHVDLLRRYESAWGGWMYYDFATHSQTPGYPPTSFTTAAGLVAFREARDAGIEVPEHLVKSCVRIVENCRLGNNAYLYSWGHRYRPLHPVNMPQGSLGRTQACNEALLEWKSPKVTLEDARRGLEDLFRLQGFLECGRKRPVPHEAYYSVSGYFYYFGHYYAGLLLSRLPEAERAGFADRLSSVIRKHQEDDGCWWDYNAIWDFHKPYGTAFALMTLIRCRGDSGGDIEMKKSVAPAGAGHVPVMLEEVVEALAVQRGDVVADVTLGLAGHAVPLLKSAGKKGRLVGIDLDRENLALAQAELAKTKLRFDLVHTNFAGLSAALGSLGLTAVDALVADLGVASTQIGRAARGFSFLRPARLDMRMDPTRGKTAADVLAEIPEARLAAALRELGDEPDAEKIARTIATARIQRPIDTTSRLVSLVCQAKGIPVPKRGWGRLHPAALTFQAIRMITNREVENLQALLSFLPSCLNPGGRAAFISFHSGEDRLVKTSFKEGLARGLYAKISPEPASPSEKEQQENPRCWSARLRWAVRA